MSYKIKSLIIFDTNSLRKVRISTKEKEIIDYSNFDFGSPFKKIKNYIEEKKIENVIYLAIPEMVILELQNQCEKQFQKEYKIIQEALARIAEIPCKNGIALADPDQEFNFKTFIIENIEAVIVKHKIIKIPFDEAKTIAIFKNMFEKVLDVEDVKSPFRPKDAGFKDNIIWESLIRYDDISEYDKIFFLTKDGDYKENCYEEFRSLWPEQEIFIRKDPSQIILDIERIYHDYLAEKEIFDYTESQIFTETLENDLRSRTIIHIGETEFPITGFVVDNFCSKIETSMPDENDVQNIAISSEIMISYTSGEETFTHDVSSLTTLFDKESKEIISIEYNIELQ